MNNFTEEKINKLLSEMTLREKVGQLHSVNYGGGFSDELKEQLIKGEIGLLSLCMTAHAGDGNAQEIAAEQLNEIYKFAVDNSPHGIPLLSARDVIHGYRTEFPIPLAMASSFNPELVEKCCNATAKEAKSDGVMMTYAPMLDVSRDPRWGRCIEGPGEDPYLGEVMAVASVKGFQGDKKAPESMGACAKHFVGYGLSEGGRDYNRTEISEYSLRNVYLRAFRAASNAGIASMMSAFNDISGIPATANRHTMQEILKDEYGFEGFIISDWNAVFQLVRQGVAADIKEAAMLAKNAGLDMDMTDNAFCKLEELVNEGAVPMSVIDDSVRRILRVKLEFGLFENPTAQKIPYDIDEHRALAKEIASESMVLLKNNGILPLSKNAGKVVYLAGSMAFNKRIMNGSWSADANPEDSVTVAEGIKKCAGNNYVVYLDTAQNDEIVMRAVEGASDNPIIVVLGESDKVTGEAHSVSSIELSHEQVELVKRLKMTGKPVIGVVMAGRPLALTAAEPFLDAIIYSWHCGSQTGAAVADIIFGNVNPSGKLAMTLPRATGQIPIYYGVTRSGREYDAYYHSIRRTQRPYEDILPSPLYPFGYGLSFTEFKYSEITLDRNEITREALENGEYITASVTVTNAGSVDGKEIAECYICDKISSVMRPIRELCGFRKPFIKAGESVKIDFKIGYDALSFFGADSKQIIENGEFDVFIGADSLTQNTSSFFVK